ncbi:MAG: response regulator [Caldilineaceae bacterium]|nr:response regulator [Caldilineaceae bacterium]
MNQPNSFDRNHLSPFAQRVILGNLVLLFLLAAAISGVILYRQHLLEEQALHMDTSFRIGYRLSQLNQYHLNLHKWALLNHEQQTAGQPQGLPAYASLRVSIEEEASELQKEYQATHPADVGDVQMTNYMNTWHTLDELLTQTIQPPYNDAQLILLTGYLFEMEDTVAALIRTANVNIQEEHERWAQNTWLTGSSLVGMMVVFLLLLAWTLYSLRQFTDRYQTTAAALQSSEKRHRALLETIPDIVLRRNRDGIYTDFKPAASFGQFMPSSDFIGKHVHDILPLEIAQKSMAVAEHALATGTVQSYEYRMPNRLTGVMTDYEARVVPSGGDEVQVIVRDITEEKLQNERQQQAQKLESLGILAGGIAHDFNNLLTSMMAQISLAKAKLQRNQVPHEQLDKALTATERAADLTRQLLAYAGKSKFQVIALNLNQIIHDNIGLLETALPNRAELQLALATELPLIEADRGHIQQIVMNIAINAAEALRQEVNGLLEPASDRVLPSTIAESTIANGQSPIPTYHFVRIRTGVERLTQQQAEQPALGGELKPGEYVVLSIEDNGIGMDAATVQRIFDPFFSTKHKGHGLGLAATLGIMRSYGGAILVESESGVGTTFRLLFPALEKPHADNDNPPQMLLPHQTLPQRTILVIDDEAPVREVMSDILQADGYAVLQAANGQDGITAFRAHTDQINLVLLDMKMPGISGDETLQILHEIDPSLKVILSSGYTESEVDKHLRSAEIIAFLPKPFAMEQLREIVSQALTTP